MTGLEFLALADLAKGKSLFVPESVYRIIQTSLERRNATYEAKQLSPAELMCHARTVLHEVEI